MSWAAQASHANARRNRLVGRVAVGDQRPRQCRARTGAIAPAQGALAIAAAQVDQVAFPALAVAHDGARAEGNQHRLLVQQHEVAVARVDAGPRQRAALRGDRLPHERLEPARPDRVRSRHALAPGQHQLPSRAGARELLDRDEQPAPVAAIDDVQLAPGDPRAGQHVRRDVEHLDDAERIALVQRAQLVADLDEGELAAMSSRATFSAITRPPSSTFQTLALRPSPTHQVSTSPPSSTAARPSAIGVGATVPGSSGTEPACTGAFGARQRVVERRTHARGVRPHAGGAGCMCDPTHQLRGKTAHLGRLAHLHEDAVEGAGGLGPDARGQADALQWLERTRDLVA